MSGIHGVLLAAGAVPLQASATTPADGSSGSSPVVSIASTVTVQYGYPGYTYSWVYVSGDVAVIANSPTASSTTFQKGMPVPAIINAVWRCQVTDASGGSIFTNNVSITLERF